jgi:hypothetical protein
MEHQQLTPLTALARGAVAGMVGTAAMDLLWYRRYRRGGGEDGLLDWEFSAGVEGYEDAAAPAQVGKRLAEGFLQKELRPETARSMNNAVHWATGALWGAVHGLAAGSGGGLRPGRGAATGATAWASSYAMLAPAGLYKPPWQYPRSVLWKDLSAHLVYGLSTGAAFAALAGR